MVLVEGAARWTAVEFVDDCPEDVRIILQRYQNNDLLGIDMSFCLLQQAAVIGTIEFDAGLDNDSKTIIGDKIFQEFDLLIFTARPVERFNAFQYGLNLGIIN